MNVLSIDLASRRYADFGFAFLERGQSNVRYPEPEELGLVDPPDPAALAPTLQEFCQIHSVRILLLDGPQGWRHPDSSIEHMRLSERVFNTPGKTGIPGQAKPANYLKYIQFSADLFRELVFEHGWSLLTEGWAARGDRRWLVETFPSAAWSLLGLERLPSRAKRAQLDQAASNFETVTGLKLPDRPSHDELQASVVLPVGQAIAAQDPTSVILAGVDPIVVGGIIYEGLIAAPQVREPAG